MPGTDTSKAFSGCLQHKIQQFVVIFSIYPLTKVITYQFSHKARSDCTVAKKMLYLIGEKNIIDMTITNQTIRGKKTWVNILEQMDFVAKQMWY